MFKPEPTSEGACYEIRILGRLDEQWSSWFNGLTISSQKKGSDIPITTLTVRVPDQAQLRGILNKIWDLNLTLISVINFEET
jgi:hypothetical protein